MAHLIKNTIWNPDQGGETPESCYLNRRSLIAGLGSMGAVGALGTIGGLAGVYTPAWALEDPSAKLYPFERNQTYMLDRELTPQSVNENYNNFYEFGSHKQIAQDAQQLVTRPWVIKIDGLVENAFKIDIDGLMSKMPLEERLYRHRCVEAWSMTIPWSGFAFKALIDLAKPLASAKFVRIETFHDPSMASGQKQSWYPWPYVEGLRIDEASHDMAFMVTGAYGKPMAKQFGAPLRLALPWKYGFKSIKSIKRISFTEEQPKSFWEQVNGDEYGFYANVNPKVNHKRWSQASERILHSGERVPTLLFNGYAEQVAGLYSGMENQKIWY